MTSLCLLSFPLDGQQAGEGEVPEAGLVRPERPCTKRVLLTSTQETRCLSISRGPAGMGVLWSCQTIWMPTLPPPPSPTAAIEIKFTLGPGPDAGPSQAQWLCDPVSTSSSLQVRTQTEGPAWPEHWSRNKLGSHGSGKGLEIPAVPIARLIWSKQGGGGLSCRHPCE